MRDGLFGAEEGRSPTGEACYVRVAVERSIDTAGAGAAEGLTYRVDGERAVVGERVRVPLGRSDRPAFGIVVAVGGAELLDGLDPRKVKAVLGRQPGMPPTLVELGRWIARYYVTPLGMVLAGMVPAAVKRSVGMSRRTELEIGEVGDEADLPPATRSAWRLMSGLDDISGLTARELARKIGARSIAPVNRLIRFGWLRENEVERVRASLPAWPEGSVEAPTALLGRLALTEAQSAIVRGVEFRRFGVHLIRGVTGSGKTEVYLHVLEGALDKGLGAIVLVPEISLTPQTAGRFLRRFGESRVAVLHSALTASQRNRQWELTASGAARIVVGARSAVFAPVRDLGVVVVDEEHDDSGYKQDQLPRYHARDVAIKRAHLEACPALLGSATPSIESWANARAGKYRLWDLTDRLGGGRLPRVEVVDLAAQRKVRAQTMGDDRHVHLIGPRLEAAIEEAVGGGGQALLLLNRRGYANYVSCPDVRCGWVMGCDHCDAPVVYHKRGAVPPGGLVRCHHCRAEQRLPERCPMCGKRTNAFGQGTQRVEEELERKFGTTLGLSEGETLLRLDGDTMRSARDYFRALGRFARGEVKVLVGTQMIAKGLDYPNVRLVGVINADTAIHLPDFRATERTFQLVSQVAGRAGRGAAPGLVIVQTFLPREPAITAAANHDYRGFADRELRLRTEAGLPPATRMARIVVRDGDPARARASALELAELLRGAAGSAIKVTGPMVCPIARIGGYHRLAIELTAARRGELQRVLQSVRDAGKLKSDARTAVDVDPMALM